MNTIEEMIEQIVEGTGAINHYDKKVKEDIKKQLRKFAREIVESILPKYQDKDMYSLYDEKIVIGHNKTINEMLSNARRIGIKV